MGLRNSKEDSDPEPLIAYYDQNNHGSATILGNDDHENGTSCSR